MSHRKVITQLGQLELKQRLKFVDFVKSLYFNTDEKVTALCTCIIECLNANKDLPSDENLFQLIYQNKSYNANIYNKLHSKTYELFERFLAVEQLLSNSFNTKYYTAREHLNQKDTKAFEACIKDVKSQLNQNKVLGSHDFQFAYEIHRLEYDFLIRNDPRKGPLNIQDVLNANEKYFLLSHMELLIAAASRTMSYNVAFDTPLKKWVEGYFQNKDNTTPLLELYYLSLQLIDTTTKEPVYNKLLEFIQANHQHIHHEELRMSCNLLEMFSRVVYAENSDYYKKLQQLYMLMIEYNLVLLNNEISPTRYSNFITTAIRNQDIPWAISIEKTFSEKLHTSISNDYIRYNKARILFAERKYNQVSELLLETQYINIDITLGVKRLLVKTYYETKEYDLLENFLSTFKVYVHRQDEVSEYHKNIHTHFIQNIRKLMVITRDPNKKGLVTLFEKLKASSGFIESDWMLDKMRNL